MEINEGETSGVSMRPQLVEGSPTEEGTTQPTKQRRIQPDEASGTHGQLCRSCQALKLDDRSFEAPVSYFWDGRTSPSPEYLEESEESEEEEEEKQQEEKQQEEKQQEEESEDESEEEEEEEGLTFKFIPLKYTREDILPDLPTLSQSERDGCGVCALLVIAARREYYSLKWSTDSFETPRLIVSGAEYAWQPVYGPSCLGIHMDFCRGDEVCSKTIPFQISCVEEKCATWLRTRYRPLERNPLSEKTGHLLRSWLHECHDSHESCADEGASSRLPTRLLDVGGSTLNETPRLILSADELESRTAIDTHYAALSHCWGKGSRPPKTETFSISHRLQEIPLDSMPPTYRDAIMLTRCLRIRYLWIDSLCIFQDDKADWEKESAVMFDVYRNARVTLCALVNSCYDGFLPQVRREAELPFESSINPQIHGTLSLHEISARPPSYQWYEDSNGWQDCVDKSEWNQRGWTYQEKVFSPRRLICGLHQFQLDCDTMSCSEDDSIQKVNFDLSIMAYLSRYHRNNVLEAYLCWYEMLGLYVDRSLTFAQDRLPAVSSLAAIIAEKTKDSFVAGLWKADLPRGLCWESGLKSPKDPHGLPDLIRRLTNPEIFVAPSWSWACLQIWKEWRQWPAYIPQIQLIEAHTQVDGENQFGRVAGAHLTIFGKLLHIHDFSLRGSSTREHYIVTSSGSFIASWILDWKLTEEEISTGLTSEKDGSKKDIGIFMLLICTIPAVEDPHEIEVKYFNDRYGVSWEAPGQRQAGLILCSTPNKNEYLRIGVFETIDWEGGGRKLFESIREREIKLV